jgi:hypothetical protein
VGVNATVMNVEMMNAKDVELRVRAGDRSSDDGRAGWSRPREAIERAHAKSLALAAEGRCWPLKVVPDGASSPAGGVDVFESSHEGETFYEIGWMILPEFQNRGLASQVAREVLKNARTERQFGQIHAFQRSRTAPPTRSARRTASRTWESASARSPDGPFAATTGGSTCSETWYLLRRPGAPAFQ